ncbi:MAG: hypothetical protein NTX03_10015, partial [Bacteroidetes bacterium]|nr:hypothetical protein [Bacteroidota bacterium]
FIYSPFFNENKNVLKLFEAIKKFHPEYKESQVVFEKIYAKVLTGTPTEQPLRYVMTDLSRLLEEYLIWAEMEKHELYKKHLLLNAYDKRKLDKYFHQTLDSALELQGKQPLRDGDYFFYRHLIEENAYLHTLSRDGRSLGTSLQQAMDNLDYYYLANKLKYSCVILSRQNILQGEYNNQLVDEILGFIRQNNFDSIPAIAIYYQGVMTFKEPEDESHYQKLISLLEGDNAKFPVEEAKDMYTLALNYCIKKYNSGVLKFLEELLALYQTMIEKKIIFEEGELASSDYKNIVTLGLRSGKVAWVEEFIHTYKDYVPASIRDNTFNYNLAFLLYYKKEFGKALKLLQSTEFTDVYYLLDGKSLLLRTYYELNEDEPFYSLCDAFTNYLKRNKLISEYQRTVYLNFVKFAKKLMQLKQGGRGSIEELKSELETSKNVATLQWLKEKAGEL